MDVTYELFKDYPDVVSVPQVKEMLGLGLNSTYDLIKSGTIKAIPVGRRYRIPKLCVIEYVLNTVSHDALVITP